MIDYLVKNKYCDPDGETCQYSNYYVVCIKNFEHILTKGSVNAAGDTLRTLASSYGISNIVKYLENRGECVDLDSNLDPNKFPSV